MWRDRADTLHVSTLALRSLQVGAAAYISLVTSHVGDRAVSADAHGGFVHGGFVEALRRATPIAAGSFWGE
jgi:hypothetical protein